MSYTGLSAYIDSETGKLYEIENLRKEQWCDLCLSRYDEVEVSNDSLTSVQEEGQEGKVARFIAKLIIVIPLFRLSKKV